MSREARQQQQRRKRNSFVKHCFARSTKIIQICTNILESELFQETSSSFEKNELNFKQETIP